MTLPQDPTLQQSFQELYQVWGKDGGMSHGQLAALAHVSEQKIRSWLNEPVESEATIPPGMENLVPLISVFSRLRRKFTDTEAQVKWLTSPHPDFDGHKPIDVAASSLENLSWLSYYLESAATGSSSSPQ